MVQTASPPKGAARSPARPYYYVVLEQPRVRRKLVLRTLDRDLAVDWGSCRVASPSHTGAGRTSPPHIPHQGCVCVCLAFPVTAMQRPLASPAPRLRAPILSLPRAGEAIYQTVNAHNDRLGRRPISVEFAGNDLFERGERAQTDLFERGERAALHQAMRGLAPIALRSPSAGPDAGWRDKHEACCGGSVCESMMHAVTHCFVSSLLPGRGARPLPLQSCATRSARNAPRCGLSRPHRRAPQPACPS